jgi:hypothetical protein
LISRRCWVSTVDKVEYARRSAGLEVWRVSKGR